MNYSKHLSRRLHRKLNTPFYQSPKPIVPDFRIVVPPHPQKYPKHAGHKGNVYGGICNRTACSRSHATLYNRGTYGYYCAEDGMAINQHSGKHPLCIVVDHDLTHEEMDAHYRAMMEER